MYDHNITLTAISDYQADMLEIAGETMESSTDERKWIYIDRFEAMGVGFDEYICKETKECKQIWDDGHEEIFKISE